MCFFMLRHQLIGSSFNQRTVFSISHIDRRSRVLNETKLQIRFFITHQIIISLHVWKWSRTLYHPFVLLFLLFRRHELLFSIEKRQHINWSNSYFHFGQEITVLHRYNFSHPDPNLQLFSFSSPNRSDDLVPGPESDSDSCTRHPANIFTVKVCLSNYFYMQNIQLSFINEP